MKRAIRDWLYRFNGKRFRPLHLYVIYYNTFVVVPSLFDSLVGEFQCAPREPSMWNTQPAIRMCA